MDNNDKKILYHFLVIERGQQKASDIFTRVKRGMPIDIQSEPLAIAVTTIVGCAYVGHLVIYAGCLSPVIVLWLVTAITIMLFYGIFAITLLQRHQ